MNVWKTWDNGYHVARSRRKRVTNALAGLLFGCHFHKHSKPLESLIFTFQQGWVALGRCCRCGDPLVCEVAFERYDDGIECVRCAMSQVHDHYFDQVNSLIRREAEQRERLEHYERFATTMRDIAEREIRRQEAAQL